MNLRALFPSDPSRVVERLLQVVIAVNCAMLAFYITTTYRLLIHSDSAVKNLIAEEIVRTGKLFPPDWNYANGDLFVIFGHLFILPFIPFFENGFALHALSGLVSSALIIASLWLLLKELDVSRFNRLLCVALVTTGISPFFAENLFGQVSYGALLYVALFLIYFVLRYLRRSQPGAAGLAMTDLVAISVIVFLVCLGNPQRALATYGLPMLAGLACAVLISRLAPAPTAFLTRRPALVLTVMVLCAAVLGAAGHHLVLEHLTNNTYQAANARFLEFKDVVRNFVGTIQGLLFLLGGEPTSARPVVSLMGAYEALRLLFASAMLLTPVALLVALRRQGDPRVILVAAFALASLVIALFFHVFTSVPDMSDPKMVSRYFTIPVMAILIAVFVQVDRWMRDGRLAPRLGWVLICAPILASGVLTLVAPALQRPVSLGKGLSLASGPYDSALSLLRANDLHYGYAPYWQAGVLTVLSGGDVKVRPIFVTGEPQPMRHLASNYWYRPEAHVGPSFILLSESDYQLTRGVHIEASLGMPQRMIQQDGWRVLVYPFNIATRLAWGAPQHALDAPLQDFRYRLRMVAGPRTLVAGTTGLYELEVSNLGSETYSSAGTAPVNLGAHLLGADGKMIELNLARGKLPAILAPGATQRVSVPVRIEQEGNYRLSFDLVQEGVTWFASREAGSELVMEATVTSPP